MFGMCAYMQMTTRNPDQQGQSPEPAKPGEGISVDQMILPTPSLVAQLTGILTTKRYKYAMVHLYPVSTYSVLSDCKRQQRQMNTSS